MTRKQQRIGDKLATQHHAAARRGFALKVFEEVDAVVDRELTMLSAKGRRSTCAKGCSHCCRQETYVPRAEAEAAVEWLQRAAPHLIADLEVRLRAWLTWYRSEYPGLVAGGIARRDAFSAHGPQCPALVDDACSIYPVRPVFCRTYHVSSPADACRPAADPAHLDVPVEVLAIAAKTTPIASTLRAFIQSQGSDFKGSVHLLAEWLIHLLEIEPEPWRTSPPPSWTR